MSALLGPWKYVIYVAIVAAFAYGVIHAKNLYDTNQREIGAAPYKRAIEDQKREAARVLEEAKRNLEAEALETKKRTDEIVKRLTDENATIRNQFAALRAAHGGLLRDKDARCGNGSGSTTTGETKAPGISEGTGSGVELSARLDGLLWNLLRDTRLTIGQYEACKAYAVSISEKE